MGTKPLPNLPGFTRAEGLHVVRRLVLSIDGKEGSGKTRFALTAPGPIALLNFDIGLEGVIEQFQSKPIYIAKFQIDGIGSKPAAVIPAAEKLLDQFETAYRTALAEARTIVIDTGSELWELIRLAAFGKLTQVQPFHYGPVNTHITSIVKRVFDTEANLILIHKMKEKWANDKPTGEFEPAGFKDMQHVVQVIAHAEHLDDNPEHVFRLTIDKCRQNVDAVGRVLHDEEITFADLALKVFPDTTRAIWE